MAIPVWLSTVINWVSDVITNPNFWLGSVLTLLILFLFRNRAYSSQSITINIPFGIGNITYDTSPADRIVAWKLYIQLATRKAALPFDEKYDLVIDVYDSLFELFKITRDLLLELPPREFQQSEGIASLMLRVLNYGVRPHLTKWQADFRKWHETAIHGRKYSKLPPQEIQRHYPHYEELLEDLQKTNIELSKFADELRDIASQKVRPNRRQKITPSLPAPNSQT